MRNRNSPKVRFLSLAGVKIFQTGQALVGFNGKISQTGVDTVGIALCTVGREPPGIDEGLLGTFHLLGDGVECEESPALIRPSRWERWAHRRPRAFAQFVVKGPPGASFQASCVLNGSAFGFSYAVVETSTGQAAITGYSRHVLKIPVSHVFWRSAVPNVLIYQWRFERKKA